MIDVNISVIIPTKNRAELLDITLNNILAQSLPPKEIIVIDDNSTDNTVQLIETKYKNKVIILRNKGKGPGAARNTGLEVSQGDYIKFFDSDDVMTLNTLEEQAKVLKDSSEGMVYSPYVHAYQDDLGNWIQRDVILQFSPIPQYMSLAQCMARGFFTVIPGCLFKREFLDKVGKWREDITAYEDWDYLWRIAKLCPNPLHTNKCAMIYRIHGSQTTGNHFSDLQRDLNKISCYSDALKSSNNMTRFTGIDKGILLTHIYISLKKLNKVKSEMSLFSNTPLIIFELYVFFIRINDKINRMVTKSNWKVMHGINRSENQYKNYINML